MAKSVPGIILLVDDDDQVRRFCRDCLVRNGFDVIEADNGFDALLLAAYQCGFVDLLITDVEMPQIRGPELVEAFRSLWPRTKTLCMSGAQPAIFGERTDEPILRKPFRPNQLVATVHDVLARFDSAHLPGNWPN